MKKFTLIVCALSIFALSYGQNELKIDQSKLQFNLGVGLSTWGIPVYVGADYWLTEDVTIGAEVSARYNLRGSYAAIGGSVNGNYHIGRLLDLPDNMDLYGGLSFGPYFSLGGYWSHINFGFSGQVGGRYKINDKMWIHGELGGGSLSGAKFGITIRR
jgi:outer membrane immunogenic protein